MSKQAIPAEVLREAEAFQSTQQNQDYESNSSIISYFSLKWHLNQINAIRRPDSAEIDLAPPVNHESTVSCEAANYWRQSELNFQQGENGPSKVGGAVNPQTGPRYQHMEVVLWRLVESDILSPWESHRQQSLQKF